MWSFDRRAVLAGAGALALSGCFRPMLAVDEPARELRHMIALPEVDSRFEHHLVRTLEDRLGEPRAPAYRLDLVTTVTERGLAVAADDAVTRVMLLADATWSLWRPGDATPVLRETAVSESGFNATASLFGTRQVRRDVEERLARDLGERIARTILARADELAG